MLASFFLFVIITTASAGQDQFMFPPQFNTPNLGILSTENSVYLPPESPTPIPFFPVKNNNKNTFPYFPPSETKNYAQFSTNFPFPMSSTTATSINKHDGGEAQNFDRRPSSLSQPFRNNMNPYIRNNSNFTDKEKQINEKQEKTEIPDKNYMHQSIDRIDVKLFNQYMNDGPTTPIGILHTPTDRNMIISVDNLSDHVKQGSYQNYQNIQMPKMFIASTTETAIPILRLSNEMDLDGSFSYEALGADQTHYVQHSRIDNFGTDNEGQVVEGSYSYVGDDGQTYTVNYTADSNGFRASGNHLPVQPPIPEIIQRSIQYNLAHEARKQPDTKDDGKEFEVIDSDKQRLFTLSPQRLFTGQIPESFSYGFSGYNTHNNLMSSASTQAPMKTNMEFMQNYGKGNPSSTITPQITFLASQGARTPSVNNPENAGSTVKSVDRPFMPQLINYEAPVKDIDQEENKSLWRWQYGINTGSNPVPEKNSISRSYGEDDGVMINFNDMTPDQYENMIRLHFKVDQAKVNQNEHQVQSSEFVTESSTRKQMGLKESFSTSTQIDDWHKRSQINSVQNKEHNFSFNNKIKQRTQDPGYRSDIITHHDYLPSSEIVTQSFNYDNTFYDPKKIKSLNSDIKSLPLNNNDKTHNIRSAENVTIEEPYFVTSEATPFKLTKFTNSYNEKGYTLLLSNQTNSSHDQHATQTSTENFENLLKGNIFIKNLFSHHNDLKSYESQAKDAVNYYRNSDTEIKQDNFQDSKQSKLSLPHESQGIKNKPLDMAHVHNYISSKSQFESNKLRPKSKPYYMNFNELDESTSMHLHKNRDEDASKITPQHSKNDYQNHQKQEEIRGVLKNYKVLQRNNGAYNRENDDERIKRVLIPPQGPSLPPLGRAGPTTNSYLPPNYV